MICALFAMVHSVDSMAHRHNASYCVPVLLLQLQEEVLKRQLEVAALENTKEIKMRELEHKEKVW